MTVEKDPAAGAWHVDRRVPIALIVTILIQTGAAIWWASSVNSFMGDTQKAAGALEVRVTKVEGTTQDEYYGYSYDDASDQEADGSTTNSKIQA